MTFIYDVINKKTIEVTGGNFKISPRTASVLVIIPEDGKREVKDGKLYIDEVVVDYNYSLK